MYRPSTNNHLSLKLPKCSLPCSPISTSDKCSVITVSLDCTRVCEWWPNSLPGNGFWFAAGIFLAREQRKTTREMNDAAPSYLHIALLRCRKRTCLIYVEFVKRRPDLPPFGITPGPFHLHPHPTTIAMVETVCANGGLASLRNLTQASQKSHTGALIPLDYYSYSRMKVEEEILACINPRKEPTTPRPDSFLLDILSILLDPSIAL